MTRYPCGRFGGGPINWPQEHHALLLRRRTVPLVHPGL